MSAATRLRHRVAEGIVRRELWQAGARVVVAVSGGLDSVCLLDLLLETRGMHNAVLSVLTVDHGTRPDSARDAAFVAGLAAERGLDCQVVEGALGVDASEADCRALRQRAYAAADGEIVATAHHQDDQAETILLQLLRGAGTAGLGGMRWRSGRVARPLLGTPRSALVAWAQARGLVWREDPSNASARFTRNRLRTEVMPLLADIRPGATAALARSAAIAAEDDALLAELAPSAPTVTDPLSARVLLDAHPALARRTVLRWLGHGTTSAHVDEVLEIARRGAGVATLSNRVSVSADDLPGHLVVRMVRGIAHG